MDKPVEHIVTNISREVIKELYVSSSLLRSPFLVDNHPKFLHNIILHGEHFNKIWVNSPIIDILIKVKHKCIFRFLRLFELFNLRCFCSRSFLLSFILLIGFLALDMWVLIFLDLFLLFFILLFVVTVLLFHIPLQISNLLFTKISTIWIAFLDIIYSCLKVFMSIQSFE